MAHFFKKNTVNNSQEGDCPTSQKTNLKVRIIFHEKRLIPHFIPYFCVCGLVDGDHALEGGGVRQKLDDTEARRDRHNFVRSNRNEMTVAFA